MMPDPEPRPAHGQPSETRPPDQNLACRRATLEEVDEVLPLVREFYHHFGFPWEDDPKRRHLAEFVSSPNASALWVLRLGPQPVGYALVAFYHSLEFDGRVALLDELHVAAAWRNRGFGGWFLARVLTELEAAGLPTVRLELDDAHAGAAALYSRLGFRPGGRHLWTRRRES